MLCDTLTRTHSLTHKYTHSKMLTGLDYTVAHYGIVTQDPRLDAVLCFVREQVDDSAWDDGEVRVFSERLYFCVRARLSLDQSRSCSPCDAA